MLYFLIYTQNTHRKNLKKNNADRELNFDKEK